MQNNTDQKVLKTIFEFNILSIKDLYSFETTYIIIQILRHRYVHLCNAIDNYLFFKFLNFSLKSYELK